MSDLGELFGYDTTGHDILGTHQDEQNNCPVCGVSAYRHTAEMEAECMRKLFEGRVSGAEK
jgi:hypothetical protein